ncbi:hypothetical protein DM01DRAFT_1410920 [Hesseltinella vesiculosa]|uniref:ZZ-type domain-containing protein n=1 Tax=Hesseltinella vesiculosa TaxID=101127 RepID=A0A1X2G6V7_9FUNG|nr:hypothetical protein DM01DRAFT_1410920 [Hesseltinella vesiculosa]
MTEADGQTNRTWFNLYQYVASTFKLQGTPFEVLYYDDDKDYIAITNDAEYQLLLSMLRERKAENRYCQLIVRTINEKTKHQEAQTDKHPSPVLCQETLDSSSHVSPASALDADPPVPSITDIPTNTNTDTNTNTPLGQCLQGFLGHFEQHMNHFQQHVAAQQSQDHLRQASMSASVALDSATRAIRTAAQTAAQAHQAFLTSLHPPPQQTAARPHQRPHSFRHPPHLYLFCDGCHLQLNKLSYWVCGQCPDYHLCASCYPRRSSRHQHQNFTMVDVQAGASETPIKPTTATEEQTSISLDAKHDGVICDHCSNTITGIRYKCGHCKDYDLCERCEPLLLHDPDHVFMKLRRPLKVLQHVNMALLPKFEFYYKTTPSTTHEKPEAISSQDASSSPAPPASTIRVHPQRHPIDGSDSSVHSFGSRRSNSTSSSKSITSHVSSRKQQHGPVHVTVKRTVSTPGHRPVTTTNVQTFVHPSTSITLPHPPSSARPDLSLLAASFVEDINVPDGAMMPVGQQFIKVWKLKNVGQVPWPQGTSLIFHGGDIPRPYRPTSQRSGVVPACLPGEEVQVAIELLAPHSPGRHVSYFRLTTADGKRFGDQLWCDITAYNTASAAATNNNVSSNDNSPPTTSPEPTMATTSSDYKIMYPTLATGDDDESKTQDTHTVASVSAGSVVTLSITGDEEEEEEEDRFELDNDPLSSPSLASLNTTDTQQPNVASVEPFTLQQDDTDDEQDVSLCNSPTSAPCLMHLLANDFILVNEPLASQEPLSVPNEKDGSDSKQERYGPQLAQLHEMGITYCDELAKDLLNDHDGKLDLVIPLLLDLSLYPK